jgi:hypothetical protein
VDTYKNKHKASLRKMVRKHVILHKEEEYCNKSAGKDFEDDTGIEIAYLSKKKWENIFRK